jgi:hypothetical protein
VGATPTTAVDWVYVSGWARFHRAAPTAPRCREAAPGVCRLATYTQRWNGKSAGKRLTPHSLPFADISLTARSPRVFRSRFVHHSARLVERYLRAREAKTKKARAHLSTLVARPEECMQGLARRACVRSAARGSPDRRMILQTSSSSSSVHRRMTCARCTVSASDSRDSRCSTRPIERGSRRGPPGVALGTSLVTPLCSQRSPAYDRDQRPACGGRAPTRHPRHVQRRPAMQSLN